MKLFSSALAATAFALMPSGAFAQSDELVLYCSADEHWCEAMSEAFQLKTGISVQMTRKSSGETFAKIKAEHGEPRGDIWWGGSGDLHLQAAEEGLTEEYISPLLGELQRWAVRQAETSHFRTVGIYAGILGFGYNSNLIDDPAPNCWTDLLEERFRSDIRVGNPNSSGTAYTMLATLVQLFGEDDAFAFMTALDRNISTYTHSGSTSIRSAANGETAVGIVFVHDAVAQTALGAPIVSVAPCEGTGYEVGSMSIIAGAKNSANARVWYDWALSAEAQEIGAMANSFQVPSNVSAAYSPKAPDLWETTLIDYDFARFGSSKERTRLLKRWEVEIESRSR